MTTEAKDIAADRRRAARAARHEDRNIPLSINMHAADDVAHNLPDSVAALLDFFVTKDDELQAANEAKYRQTEALRAQISEAQRVASMMRTAYEETPQKERTKADLRRVEIAEAKVEKLQDRLAKAKKAKPSVKFPQFHGSRVVQFLLRNARRPVVEVTPAIPAKLRKLEPAAALEAVRADIEKKETEADRICAALAPHDEGVRRFEQALNAKAATGFNWKSLLNVKHGEGGRIVESIPEVPDSVIAEALRPFVVSHAKRMLDAVVKDAKAKGYEFLPRGIRSPSLHRLQSEIEDLEKIEGYFIRQLILAGGEPEIRGDMSTAALCGVQPDPSVPPVEKPTYFEIDAAPDASFATTPLNR